MSLEIAEFLDRGEDAQAKPQSEREKDLLQAKGVAAIATREVKEGFPVLHAQAVVTLWAYLESFVRQVAADWILNQPTCLQSEAFEKVKIRVAEYERLDPIDKAYFLVDALEREFGAGLQNGTTRFEVILRSFGLDGEIPAALAKQVFELGQIRNVIMHRAGFVDQKFVTACPWMNLRVGSSLHVSSADYSKYTHAVGAYFFLIILRIGEAFGTDVESERRGVFSEYPSSPTG
jgi:hypothetical protein